MVNPTTVGAIAMIAMGWVSTPGCSYSSIDTGHCNYNEGNAHCAELYPAGEFPFCESGRPGCISPQKTNGCVAERPTNECYSPCGDVSTIDEDGTCLSGASSSGTETAPTDGSTDTEPTSGEPSTGTTGPMPCVDNGDCPGSEAPICDPDAGSCVGCDGVTDGDLACSGLNPSTPLCVGGSCVQCTEMATEACEGETPVCDLLTSSCAPCSEHAECGDAACNMFTGACVGGSVAHVGGANPDFSTLQDALDGIGVGAEGTIVVHQGDYNEVIAIGGGRTVALLANEGDLPSWDTPGAGMASQLTVNDAVVLVDHIEMSGNGSSEDPGLVVDGGRAWADRVRIVGNDGGGIVAQGNAELVVRNAFIGGDASNTDAVVINGATASLIYSTIVAGDGGLGQSRALVCDGEATVVVRNSVLVAIDDVPEIACSDVDISSSATEADMGGEGNVALGDLQDGWFVNETNDFHLVSPPFQISNAADWLEGDPTIDIDGDPRPEMNGAEDVAGADAPPASQ